MNSVLIQSEKYYLVHLSAAVLGASAGELLDTVVDGCKRVHLIKIEVVRWSHTEQKCSKKCAAKLTDKGLFFLFFGWCLR